MEGIEAATSALEERGVVFLGAVVGEPGAFRHRGFQDPDGNMLYIIQKPA